MSGIVKRYASGRIFQAVNLCGRRPILMSFKPFELHAMRNYSHDYILLRVLRLSICLCLTRLLLFRIEKASMRFEKLGMHKSIFRSSASLPVFWGCHVIVVYF